MNYFTTSATRGAALAAAAFVLLSGHCWSQDATNTSAPSETTQAVRNLQEQVHELRELVEEMRAENVQSRAEMQKLRQDLQTTRALLEPPEKAANSADSIARNSSASIGAESLERNLNSTKSGPSQPLDRATS